MTEPAPPPAAGCALFLDVDGTLLELAPRPDEVHVPPPLIRLLTRLERALGGAIALISGRSLDDLDGLFAPLTLPAAGVHGLLRRTAGGDLRQHESSSGWRRNVHPALLEFAAAHPGALLEDKGHALALHYRRAPELAGEAEALARRLVHAAHPPVRLLHGKMVLEFMPDGSDKGTAVQAFAAESPFAGRTPVFIGDDVTDEAGFRAVNALGGMSIRVGPTTGSAARHSLADVPSVYAWLDRLSRIDTDGMHDV